MEKKKRVLNTKKRKAQPEEVVSQDTEVETRIDRTDRFDRRTDQVSSQKLNPVCIKQSLAYLIENCEDTPDWLKNPNIKVSNEVISVAVSFLQCHIYSMA